MNKMAVQMISLESIEDHAEPIRHCDYKGTKRTKNYARNKLAWNARPFIAWDGEGTQPEPNRKPSLFVEFWHDEYVRINGTEPDGYAERFDLELPEPQPYVLLANSQGEDIRNREGLSTSKCFDFILDSKRRNPTAHFVGFGFTYDSAQILKDLSKSKLRRLYNTNKCRYQEYNIEYYPRRWLRITNRISKITATIWDVFGFFQTTFLAACEKYLGRDDPGLEAIRLGKEARDSFRWDELEDKIVPYNRLELDMLVRMMNQLRSDFHDVDLDLTKWYGPGVIANALFKKHDLKKVMNKEIERDIINASQHAYAGGRFEQFQLGFYPGTVWEYDIRSAYATAVAKLPQLSDGNWTFVDGYEPGTFGVWYISYQSRRRDNQPQPLFRRARDGRVGFPHKSDGWYWTPEADLVPEYVQCGYVWRPSNSNLAFPFVESIYTQRADYKRRGISAERALKALLTCIYGKLAQVVGSKEKSPTWHQLEWAGWITSYTRATIYKAILLNPSAIIATETDALFSTEPLPLDLGEGLGQWEETVFDSITYLQSGFYYATQGEKVICKYRGMDRDRETMQPVGLPYREVLDHLRQRNRSDNWRTKALNSSTTRFVNIGLALNTSATFRSWETRPKRIFLDQRPERSKRYHIECSQCRAGLTLGDCLHPLLIGGEEGWSHPHPLPWVDGVAAPEYEEYLEQEIIDFWQ
jgi:hypothetical protein